MINIPYAIFITNDKFISNESITIFSNVSNLQILAPNVNEYDFIHKNVSIYTFSLEQYKNSKKMNYSFHLSLLGKDIYNQDLFDLYQDNIEIFWFPSIEQINNSLENIIFYLIKLNKPICISYNPYIQKNISLENFRLFVKKIHKHFKNPIYIKDLNLLNTEIYDNNNKIIIQENNNLKIFPVILGFFGDYPVYDEKKFLSQNIKGILKQKECQQCEYTEQCISRGLGYIITELNYQGCIGIKLTAFS